MRREERDFDFLTSDLSPSYLCLETNDKSGSGALRVQVIGLGP